MFKEDLALNNLQGLIFHKTKQKQILYAWCMCIKMIWNQITCNAWYAIKPNQTKPNHIYLIYGDKNDLELDNLQCLICHKTKFNQPKSNPIYLIDEYMYKEDLEWNNLQCLICHKTNSNQAKSY